MITQSDIPKRIAKGLFCAGFIWAMILMPLMIIGFASGVAALFDQSSRDWWPLVWRSTLYLAVGFGVWFGWLWRARQRRSLSKATAFWLFSAAFNSAILFIMMAEGWVQSLVASPWDSGVVIVSWGIATALASLIALVFEFRLPRHESTVA